MVWTAAFTFLAAFFSPAPQRPKTMGNDMMQLEEVDQYVGLAGLFGAIVRDVLTLWWGLTLLLSWGLQPDGIAP